MTWEGSAKRQNTLIAKTGVPGVSGVPGRAFEHGSLMVRWARLDRKRQRVAAAQAQAESKKTAVKKEV